MGKELNKKQAISAIKKVVDPELGLDVYTLGLVYGIDLNKGDSISIKMTLTSPMCPFGPAIMSGVKMELQKKGFNNTEVEFVFDPPWEPSDNVKDLLGLA